MGVSAAPRKACPQATPETCDRIQSAVQRAVKFKRGIPRLHTGGSSAARNLALDHHRRETRRPETTAASPAQAATQDSAIAVNEALAQLAAVDRDVFLLREVAGLGYAEIAVACEITPDGVRSRVHRARVSVIRQ